MTQNASKRALKMCLRSKIQNVLPTGKGHPLPLEPHPPQTHPFVTSCNTAPPPQEKASCASSINLIV